MNGNFRFVKPTEKDRTEFISMSADFYASDAIMAPVPASFHENAFDELMRSERYVSCYFFIYEGKTAGFALIAKSYSREAGGTVIWVDELYLKPEYRGKGAATHFFHFLEQNVPAARYRLEVEEDNMRARKLYESKGYRYLPYLQMIKGS